MKKSFLIIFSASMFLLIAASVKANIGDRLEIKIENNSSGVGLQPVFVSHDKLFPLPPISLGHTFFNGTWNPDNEEMLGILNATNFMIGNENGEVSRLIDLEFHFDETRGLFVSNVDKEIMETLTAQTSGSFSLIIEIPDSLSFERDLDNPDTYRFKLLSGNKVMLLLDKRPSGYAIKTSSSFYFLLLLLGLLLKFFPGLKVRTYSWLLRNSSKEVRKLVMDGHIEEALVLNVQQTKFAIKSKRKKAEQLLSIYRRLETDRDVGCISDENYRVGVNKISWTLLQ